MRMGKINYKKIIEEFGFSEAISKLKENGESGR